MPQTDIIALVLLSLLAAYGSWTDITNRHLSNWLCLATLLAGLGFAVFGSNAPTDILSHLGHFGIALAIGLALFAGKVWGGGDGKFYAAVAAWFPLGDFFTLMVTISLTGLALLLAMVVRARGRLFGKNSRGVPYGVAIGLGAAVTLGQQIW